MESHKSLKRPAASGAGVESTLTDNPQKIKKRMQKYKSEYSKTWPVLQQSRLGENSVFCSACQLDFTVAHGGRDDCRRHINSKRHQEYSKLKTRKIDSFFKPPTSSTEQEVTRAETLFTHFLLEHNLAIAASDHAGKLFRQMFPDSTIAKKYHSARTKTTVITGELSKEMQKKLCHSMDKRPFSLSTDGSTDKSKMYPIVVRHFDEEAKEIAVSLLSVPNCNTDATGEGIFQVLHKEMQMRALSWSDCIAFGSDNASVMTGCNLGRCHAYLGRRNMLLRDFHLPLFVTDKWVKCYCELILGLASLPRTVKSYWLNYRCINVLHFME